MMFKISVDVLSAHDNIAKLLITVTILNNIVFNEEISLSVAQGITISNIIEKKVV